MHLLTTVSGAILDYSLTSAHVRDLAAGEELLWQHTARVLLADKAYVSAPVAAALSTQRQLILLTWPHKNQCHQLPEALHKPFHDLRRRIETLISQLTEQFKLERNHAHTFFGLCTRLATKLAARTLCLWLNRLMGHPNPLSIKHLAFPI